MKDNQTAYFKTSWVQFGWRITACHVVTYFLAGILALNFLNYKELFSKTILDSLMRPLDSPWVAAGPALQIIRGILFTLVLYPLKEILLESKWGWFKLWLLFLGLAILGTAGPTPGSIEGIIYTKLPLQYHLQGLPEVVIQTLLFSLGLFFWYKKPARTWNILMAAAMIFIILMSLAGAFLGR